MSRILVACVLAATAAGCASDPVFCEGETQFESAFPDDFYTVADDATATGLRVHLNEDNAPWVGDQMPLAIGLYEDLKALDGFGTSAGVTLRFSGPVTGFPSGDHASVSSDAVVFVELSDDGPVRVPFEVQPSDEGATMIVWPLRPLRPNTQHALIVTRGATDATGACISPSPRLRSFLSGKNVPKEQSFLTSRYETALSALKIAPDDVGAATVFTTGTIFDASRKVAHDVSTRSFQWATSPTCADVSSANHLTCTGSFMAGSYTKDDVYVDGTVQSTYEIPVVAWIPKTGQAPFPVVLYGHGLAGTKEEARSFAGRNAELGIATVAIDAVGHGRHPTLPPDSNTMTAVLDFFGIQLKPLDLNPFRLRDHLRASTWDKLQLVRLLTTHPSIDGFSLDTTRMAYAGLSLGGIMGSELLALTDAFDAAILMVAGGRIASIVSDSDYFSLFLEAFRGPDSSPGDVDTLVPLLQTLIDAGDGVNYAPRVLGNRFDFAGGKAPHLLFGAVIDDDTVVNASNHALARALGAPQLAPVVTPVGVIDVVENGPVKGNMPGNRTAAFFQYDRFTEGPEVVKALHGTVFVRPEPQLQIKRFLQTWLSGDAPEIIDPYARMGTPALP